MSKNVLNMLNGVKINVGLAAAFAVLGAVNFVQGQPKLGTLDEVNAALFSASAVVRHRQKKAERPGGSPSVVGSTPQPK